ncbi:hypothetical protein FPRO05_00850 [Fusarium proliferatum]|uniref:Uncharacterized protein n=1 Tax=Gibberella intermedia TaxID=948311 RepID=A0A365NP25_GIBIN|nr:hypothetical protein FPRO05_00850 [Fusarium proliferatum]
MVRPYEMIDELWHPPRWTGAPVDRNLSEYANRYTHWGYTIYRTHYSPASDKQWEILLDCLRRQTRLALGYYMDEDWNDEVLWQKASHLPPICYTKSEEEYKRDVKRLQDLFHLGTREDPSFDGLTVRQIRQVCVDDPPEHEKTMAGYRFRYILLADKAVFESMEKGEFIIKVVAYDWEEEGENWGWMRIPTGYLLDFWHALLLREDYVHRVIPFEGPEEDLEHYVWPGGVNLDGTGAYSEVRQGNHYEGQKNGFMW